MNDNDVNDNDVTDIKNLKEGIRGIETKIKMLQEEKEAFSRILEIRLLSLTPSQLADLTCSKK